MTLIGGLATKVPKLQNNPAARAAKIEIRRNVLNALGRPAVVFDAFAGLGEMHRNVWCDAAGYVGCERTWIRDGRELFVADNRRVMRAIDLHEFNIFDLDAHGSPWTQAVILCARRTVAPGERIGLILTDGTSIKLRITSMDKGPGPDAALVDLTGVRSHFSFGAVQNELIELALRSIGERLSTRVAERWDARAIGGARTRYIGLVLEGVSDG